MDTTNAESLVIFCPCLQQELNSIEDNFAYYPFQNDEIKYRWSAEIDIIVLFSPKIFRPRTYRKKDFYH